jgi:hypothetical protein
VVVRLVCEMTEKPQLHRSIRNALKLIDRDRGEYWMCRKDSDPKGRWTICLDPYQVEWDWRVKIGANNVRAVRRITNAAKYSEISDNLMKARQIVDRLRTEARVSRLNDGC